MSGFRTLHRITNSDDGSSPSPVCRVKFSPCRCSSSSSSSLRVLAAGASNIIKCYSLTDRTEKDVNSNDVLDASAMNVDCSQYLISRDDNHTDNTNNNKAVLGYAALDIVRNYCGEDITAGNEVVMASKLGGHVAIWVTLDPVLKEKGVVVAEDIAGNDNDMNIDNSCQYKRPYAEFKVTSATGTTLAIRPPILGNYYSKKETDILVAMGCANGAVVICKTGILASRPGDNGITSRSGNSAIVGDTSADDTVVMNITSFHNNNDNDDDDNNLPGQIIATVGGGHACVMSLAWHPTIPNTFVVGRKDGIIDIYSAQNATTSEEYYYGREELNFRRVHRLVHSSFPIRALSYSMPDGELLFAGDDDGKLYSYDASMALPTPGTSSDGFNVASPVKLVGCALAAHKGWIMDLTAFPDGNRVATCGSDRSVRVWGCGLGLASGTPIHSFDGVNEGLVWGVDCSGGSAASGGNSSSGARLKLICSGNDGSMQVFSCSE